MQNPENSSNADTHPRNLAHDLFSGLPVSTTSMTDRVINPSITAATSVLWSNDTSAMAQEILQQITPVIHGVLRSAAHEIIAEGVDEETEWSLTGEQMLYMFQHHNDIDIAFEEDNIEYLRELAASTEFTNLFGEMGFDEAYDRYITTLEEGRA